MLIILKQTLTEEGKIAAQIINVKLVIIRMSKKQTQSSSLVNNLGPQEQSRRLRKSVKLRNYLILALMLLLLIILCIHEYFVFQQQYQIAIIGTNDLHGQVYPTILQRSDNNQQYKYGGLTYLVNMIKTIKQQFSGNVLYFDAGDQFQGGIEASKHVSNGQIMNDYFKSAGLNGSSIGNHEFDINFQFLNQFFQGRNSTNLAANLLSEKGEHNFLPHHLGSQIYQTPNGIKIGAIGLATIETKSTTAGFSEHIFPSYKFLPYKQVVIEHSKKLRQLGAHAVLIVSHVGDACASNNTLQIHENSEQKVEYCPPDELSRLIDVLPFKTIDGVIQGHRHRLAHRFYKRVPEMGSINGGFYFNVMYLRFNKHKKLIKSRIQGPIPVCEKIFENIKQCCYLQGKELLDAGPLVQWQFHNKKVQADASFQQLLQQKYSEKMSLYNEKIIQTQVKLSRKENKQCQLSNLFTTLLSKSGSSLEPDFAFLNTGLFRSIWYPGTITYRQLYNMFPFQNKIQIFEITGREIIDSIREIVTKARRVLQFWNIKMVLQLNQNNSSGSKMSLKQLSFANGSIIEENKLYKGISLSYLVNGGDAISLVKGTFFNPKNVVDLGDFITTLKPYLQEMKNIYKGTLIDPKNPRISIVKH